MLDVLPAPRVRTVAVPGANWAEVGLKDLLADAWTEVGTEIFVLAVALTGSALSAVMFAVLVNTVPSADFGVSAGTWTCTWMVPELPGSRPTAPPAPEIGSVNLTVIVLPANDASKLLAPVTTGLVPVVTMTNGDGIGSTTVALMQPDTGLEQEKFIDQAKTVPGSGAGFDTDLLSVISASGASAATALCTPTPAVTDTANVAANATRASLPARDATGRPLRRNRLKTLI